MNAGISVRETEYVAVVEIVGRLTVRDSESRLQEVIRDLLFSQHINIILDSARVTYLDSSGLGQLVASAATAIKAGAELKLMNLNQCMYDLMVKTRLCTVFLIYADEATALDSFSEAPEESRLGYHELALRWFGGTDPERSCHS